MKGKGVSMNEIIFIDRFHKLIIDIGFGFVQKEGILPLAQLRGDECCSCRDRTLFN
jgi:hypothetical protein